MPTRDERPLPWSLHYPRSLFPPSPVPLSPFSTSRPCSCPPSLPIFPPSTQGSPSVPRMRRQLPRPREPSRSPSSLHSRYYYHENTRALKHMHAIFLSILAPLPPWSPGCLRLALLRTLPPAPRASAPRNFPRPIYLQATQILPLLLDSSPATRFGLRLPSGNLAHARS